MNAQLQQLVDRYEHLNQRDKVALRGLSAFFAIIFLYALVWLPANNYFVDRNSDHQKQIELHQYLLSSEKQARASSGQKSQSIGGQSILQTVSRSAQKFSLKPDRLQPEGSDGVSVMFNDVNFNKLIQWLDNLDRQGFSVKQISIERSDVPGIVTTRMVLRA
ncbi:MAG: general secretion pathway protein M [Candidatus Azotimanducaceae bacterium]|jgi:general secretion pathway protein M